MKKAYIFSGPPGCGKGSIIREMMQMGLSGQVIPMSAELMKMAKTHRRGEEIRQSIASGHLVSDDLTIEAFNTAWNAVKTLSGIFYFDGCARTEFQVDCIYSLLRFECCFQIYQISVIVPLHVCRDRMIKRGRVDDTPEIIDVRCVEYQNKTELAIAALSSLNVGKNVEVNNEKDPKIAAQEVILKLKAIDREIVTPVNARPYSF